MVTRVRQTSSSALVSAAQRTARPLMKNDCDLDHLLGGLLAVHGKHRVPELAVAEAVVHRLAVADVAHGHVRVAHQHAGHGVRHQPALVAGLLQKRPPHRQVVEQALHHEGGALGAADLLHAQVLPAVDVQPNAGLLPLRAGGHLHMGHRCDGRQRLAAKAQRADVVELLGALQL